MAIWYEDLTDGSAWSSLWHGYIVCGDCEGIRRPDGVCPACGAAAYSPEPSIVRINGRDITVHSAFAGAEGRIEDYVYLEMLQREWQRPAPEFARFAGYDPDNRPSARAALILLFWTYFETRIERLLRGAMRTLPNAVSAELLERHGAIGQRLYRLYRILFSETYFGDLKNLGFPDVAEMLTDIHDRRNKFTHGNPQAIDDHSVERLVVALKREHEAWIAVFNSRAVRVAPSG